MKPVLFIVFILSNILLAGCKDQAAEKKMADLEARVQRLETDSTNQNGSLVDLGRETVKLSLDVLTNEMASRDRYKRLEEGFTNLSALDRGLFEAFTNLDDEVAKTRHGTNAPREAGIRPHPTPAGLKSGIPALIYDQIQAAAEKKWPGEFDMQAYEVEKQVAAYKKLHP
jgi:hypothetical protein